MKIEGNTILITGGATGIGFALAEAFVGKGNEVIICGRRENKLKEAKAKIPNINTIRCDVTKIDDRAALYKIIRDSFKDINILINNAGIGRIINLKSINSIKEEEICTNLVAPIHLSAHFIPDFINKKESAIINVTSGLSYVPMAVLPIYCATKAGLHSFSISLRYQLKDTPIKVFEILPPIVDTDFHGDSREQVKSKSIPASLVAEETLKAIEKDEFEIPIGMSKNLRMINADNFQQFFQTVNQILS